MIPAADNQDVRRAGLSRVVLELVAAEGLEGVSIRSVAVAAGVSIGTVQYHFPTKDALLLHAQALANEAVGARAEAATEGLEDPREALSAVILAVLPLDEESARVVRVFTAFETRALHSPALAASAREDARELREVITELLRMGGSSGPVSTRSRRSPSWAGSANSRPDGEECTRQDAEAIVCAHIRRVLPGRRGRPWKRRRLAARRCVPDSVAALVLSAAGAALAWSAAPLSASFPLGIPLLVFAALAVVLSRSWAAAAAAGAAAALVLLRVLTRAGQFVDPSGRQALAITIGRWLQLAGALAALALAVLVVVAARRLARGGLGGSPRVGASCRAPGACCAVGTDRRPARAERDLRRVSAGLRRLHRAANLRCSPACCLRASVRRSRFAHS